MTRPVIIIGGGGHARVLAEALQLAGRLVRGFTAPADTPSLAPGVSWLGSDEVLAEHPTDAVALVNGIGSVGNADHRGTVYRYWSARGYTFATVQHPSAIVSPAARIGAGAQLLAGSVIGPAASLAPNVLINTRAVIEHDTAIGTGTHVASGAILCGGCDVGEGCHVGAGAVVIQGRRIGNGAIIAAGAVVTENVDPLTLVAGVPATTKRALNAEKLEGNQRLT